MCARTHLRSSMGEWTGVRHEQLTWQASRPSHRQPFCSSCTLLSSMGSDAWSTVQAAHLLGEAPPPTKVPPILMPASSTGEQTGAHSQPASQQSTRQHAVQHEAPGCCCSSDTPASTFVKIIHFTYHLAACVIKCIAPNCWDSSRAQIVQACSLGAARQVLFP